MRVCLISASFPKVQCGVGKHTYFLAGSLKKAGISVSVLTSKDEKVETETNQKVEILPTVEWWSVFNIGQILGEIKRINPEIVHFQYPTKMNKRGVTVVFIPLLVRVCLRKHAVLTLHEFSESSFFGKIRNLLLVIFSSRTIFPNSVDLRAVSLLMPFLRNRFDHVALGPTIEVARDTDKGSDKFISFLGYMDGSKGEMVLLQSLPYVKDKNLKVLFLSALDTSNPYHKKLERLSYELGVADNVRWFKTLVDVQISAYLQKSEFCVIPYKEGVKEKHSTFLDAVSHGLPIITTKPYFPLPYLRQGENVYFVSPLTPYNLASSINKLLSDKVLREKLKYGVKKLNKRFTWEEAGRKVIQIYKGELGGENNL